MNARSYKNVSEDTREAIAGILEVHQELNTGRYLGLPSLIGRRKREIFAYIRERLWNKLQQWKGKKLSKAGKEVLIKAAAQAIPTYCMSIFLLPSTLIDELHIMLNKFWWGNDSSGSRGVVWCKWEELCRPKEMGGMGFKNLHAFNLALLGKMGWRLINDPSALVCRVLKAKYFPRTSFFQAQLGSTPSQTWRGIWTSRDVLELGTRWKVVDGNSINVWTDKWVDDDNGWRIRSLPALGLEQLRVAELMTPTSRSWNRHIISLVLEEDDIERVLRTGISPSGVADRIIWCHSKGGSYTASSAYTMIMKLVSADLDGDEGCWNKIWHASVPSKVRVCVWRVMRGFTPMKAELRRRHLPVDSLCVKCGAATETAWHIFTSCPFAVTCWEEQVFHAKLLHEMNEADSVIDWVKSVCCKLHGDELHTFMMLIWALWRDRNKSLWTNEGTDVNTLIRLTKGFLQEWVDAKKVKQGRPSIDVCKAWHKPETGMVKVNIDTAFFSDSLEMGLGFVVRDDRGCHVLSRSQLIPGILRSDEGEAICLQVALEWIRDLELEGACVEMDAKMVVDAFRSSEVRISVVGDIIEECKRIWSSYPFNSLKWVRREANMMADAIAKEARNHPSPYCWVEPPPFVDGLPDTACIC